MIPLLSNTQLGSASLEEQIYGREDGGDRPSPRKVGRNFKLGYFWCKFVCDERLFPAR